MCPKQFNNHHSITVSIENDLSISVWPHSVTIGLEQVHFKGYEEHRKKLAELTLGALLAERAWEVSDFDCALFVS